MRGERAQMSSPVKRKKYLIDKEIQIRYAILSIAMLVLYTLLLLTAIFGPPMYLYTSTDIPLTVRAEAANTVLLINSYLWPGIGLIILLFGILSIYFTHRLAGSIFAVQRVIDRVLEGDLTARVKLRKNYDLQKLGQAMNRMVEKQETDLSLLEKQFRKLYSHVRGISPEHASPNESDILASCKVIEKILEQYQHGNALRKE